MTVRLCLTSSANTVGGIGLRWCALYGRHAARGLRCRYLVWADRPRRRPRSALTGRFRKIACIAALAAIGLVSLTALADRGDAGRAAARGHLVSAELSQRGRNLVATIRTRRRVALRRLERTPAPRRTGSRYLCISLRARLHRGEHWLCLGGRRDAHHRAGLLLVNAAGRVVRRSSVRARLLRPRPRTLVLAIRPQAAGLTPRRYRWRVTENRAGCRRCAESLPARGNRVFRLRPVRAVGCTGGGAALVRNGPRDRRRVALTFDDGPSDYTDDFLAVLRRKHAHASFAVLGQEIPGRGWLLRRALREGHEIVNHSTHHGSYSSYWDMAATNALIHAASRFRPCLFRPPGGAVSSTVIDAAGRAGMRTLLWDVDPADWSTPGTGAIYSRVVGAVRPGSIVVMHDGGGPRGQTLAALPAIIETLRDRGYRFVTVSALLGERLIYRPYG